MNELEVFLYLKNNLKLKIDKYAYNDYYEVELLLKVPEEDSWECLGRELIHVN